MLSGFVVVAVGRSVLAAGLRHVFFAAGARARGFLLRVWGVHFMGRLADALVFVNVGSPPWSTQSKEAHIK